MVTKDRNPAPSLTALALRFIREGRQFDFVQAVRLVEWASPDAPRLGYSGPASKEPARFAANPSLGFPCADIESIAVEVGDAGSGCYVVTVNFMGLFGPASPLPPFYTQEVLRDETNRVRDFLDFFNHRLISLFYRACGKYRLAFEGLGPLHEPLADPSRPVSGSGPQSETGPRLPVAAKVPGSMPGETGPLTAGFRELLFSLIGLRGATMRSVGTVDWWRVLPFAGMLTMRSHSAPVVANILSEYFGGIPVEVRELVGRWVEIPEDQQACLGRPSCRLIDEGKKDSNPRCGEAAVIGSRVADLAGKFRVVLGPLSFHRFAEFLPGGASRQALGELVRFLVSDQLDFDVELRLRGTRVPPLRLGAERCRLARSTWLNDFQASKERYASLVLDLGRPRVRGDSVVAAAA